MSLTKSKIFFYFCLSFVGGVAIASFVRTPLLISGIFLIGAIAIIVLFWPARNALPARQPDGSHDGGHSNAGGARQWEIVVLGFCLIIVVCGAWRFQSKAQIAENDVSQFNDKGKIVLVGVVDEEPDVRIGNLKLKIKSEKIKTTEKEVIVSGYTLVTVEKYPEYHYGDRIEMRGALKKPENFDEFDYMAYLAKDDVYSLIYYPEARLLSSGGGNPIKALLFKIKNSFKQNLVRLLPEPQVSLANGLTLGEKTTLPQDLMDDFNAVGVTHIIALSGFNITIIIDSLRRLFNSLMISRQYSFWLAVVLIIGFVIMTGASPSIVRAAVMGILLILAQKVGRFYSIRNALIFAGVAMIFLNPKILRFDLGFQLSFMATLGLAYISPLFEKYLEWLPKRFDLRGIAGATLGAQIAVLPLILYSFGRLSVIAPIANLLILPIIPLTMFLIFWSGGVGFIWHWLAQCFGWVSWLFLTYQIKIAALLSKIPYAAIGLKINWIWLVVLYVILWGGVIKIQKSKCKIKNDNVNLKV